jgi:hypothetical protein
MFLFNYKFIQINMDKYSEEEKQRYLELLEDLGVIENEE